MKRWVVFIYLSNLIKFLNKDEILSMFCYFPSNKILVQSYGSLLLKLVFKKNVQLK